MYKDHEVNIEKSDYAEKQVLSIDTKPIFDSRIKRIDMIARMTIDHGLISFGASEIESYRQDPNSFEPGTRKMLEYFIFDQEHRN